MEERKGKWGLGPRRAQASAECCVKEKVSTSIVQQNYYCIILFFMLISSSLLKTFIELLRIHIILLLCLYICTTILQSDNIISL